MINIYIFDSISVTAFRGFQLSCSNISRDSETTLSSDPRMVDQFSVGNRAPTVQERQLVPAYSRASHCVGEAACTCLLASFPLCRRGSLYLLTREIPTVQERQLVPAYSRASHCGRILQSSRGPCRRGWLDGRTK